jgi:hypothetical protein
MLGLSQYPTIHSIVVYSTSNYGLSLASVTDYEEEPRWGNYWLWTLGRPWSARLDDRSLDLAFLPDRASWKVSPLLSG